MIHTVEMGTTVTRRRARNVRRAGHSDECTCCGDGIIQGGEECDGADCEDGSSCSAFCKCRDMPAVSEWGLIALILLLLTGLGIKFGQYRPQTR